MMGKTVGAGQVYLESQKDSEGKWLDGGKTYSLHVHCECPGSAVLVVQRLR
jgi:hypothetical protein